MSYITVLVCRFEPFLLLLLIDLDLVEDPSKLQAAAEVSIDVLFAAFEKFIKRAWRERMGPLLATDLLLYMQSKFGILAVQISDNAWQVD